MVQMVSNTENTNVVKLDQMTINLLMLTGGIHGQSVKRKRPLSLWVEKARVFNSNAPQRSVGKIDIYQACEWPLPRIQSNKRHPCNI